MKQFCETSSIFELDSIQNEAILQEILNFWTWQHPKRSNSARLPQFLNLTASKTKQFCETSSIFELDNIQNEAILRDFLNFWTWQPPKWSNSARHPQFLNLIASKTKQFCKKSSIFELDSIQNEAILRDFLNFWTWQPPKRSNSARHPQFLNLTASKTKQFCETSSILELDSIQNEAILWDFLNFSTWQHQRRSNSARRPSKMESWVQSWRPRTNASCDFSTPPV